jgi:uncharacterized protein YijF (DUF1287 family)
VLRPARSFQFFSAQIADAIANIYLKGTPFRMRCAFMIRFFHSLSFVFLMLAPLGALWADSAPLVAAARGQVGKTTVYDPAYVTLKYPGGDLPEERGVCTDVVIRALRKGHELDLQKLVHEDMASSFSAYPKNWGLKKTDKNIDHRRVPNLQTYFKRKGYSLPVTEVAADYLPGDLVTCTVPPHLPHIMIVSDKSTSDGRPLVIHNIGRGAQEEDCLFTYPLTGHYRWKFADAKPAAAVPGSKGSTGEKSTK